jgi:hypothetical protein
MITAIIGMMYLRFIEKHLTLRLREVGLTG